jgi:hypothetical protein
MTRPDHRQVGELSVEVTSTLFGREFRLGEDRLHMKTFKLDHSSGLSAPGQSQTEATSYCSIREKSVLINVRSNGCDRVSSSPESNRIASAVSLTTPDVDEPDLRPERCERFVNARQRDVTAKLSTTDLATDAIRRRRLPTKRLSQDNPANAVRTKSFRTTQQQTRRH